MIESHLWQLQGDKTVTNPVNMGIVAVFLVDHYLTVKLPGVFIAIPENNAKIQRCRT